MAITHDFATLASCDSDDLPNWTATGQGSISLNTTEFKQGSASINIYKTGTLAKNFGAYRDIPSTNLKDKMLVLWIYVSSKTVLEKLAVGRVYIYDSAGNYDYFNILANPGGDEIKAKPLRQGWNAVRIYVGQYDKRYYPVYNYAGSSATKPDTTAIVKIEIYFETVLDSDTIDEGEIAMDFWHCGRTINVEEGTWTAPYDFDGLYDFDVSNALGVIEKLHERSYRIFIDLKGSYLFFDRGSLTIEKNFNFAPTIKIEKSFIWHKYSSYDFNPDGEIYDSSILCGGYFAYCRADLIRVSVYATYGLSGFSPIHGRLPKIVDGLLDISIDFSKFHAENSTINASRSFYLASNTLLETKIVSKNTIGIRSDLDNSVNYFKNTEIVGNYTYSWYRSGKLYWQYSFDLQLLDFDGSPVPDAKVRLYDKFGNLVFEAITDVDGKIPTQWVTAKLVEWISATEIIVTDYNPFNLLILKDSIKLVDYKLNIEKKLDFKISRHNLYSANIVPQKFSFNLNENVILKARFFDWNNLPITNLTVIVEITKPDGTIKTVELKDDGVYPDEIANDGIYTGIFTETNLVGTYEAKVSTTIYGNTVEAKTYFDVGILEKKIDEIKRVYLKEGVDSIGEFKERELQGLV
jgi:hypothetical protein